MLEQIKIGGNTMNAKKQLLTSVLCASLILASFLLVYIFLTEFAVTTVPIPCLSSQTLSHITEDITLIKVNILDKGLMVQ